jgi:hypothetical protein
MASRVPPWFESGLKLARFYQISMIQIALQMNHYTPQSPRQFSASKLIYAH